MSRLTEKHEFFKNVLPKENIVGDELIYECLLSVDKYTAKPHFYGIAVNKLAELEDVLEEFGIESAEELRERLGVLETALEKGLIEKGGQE